MILHHGSKDSKNFSNAYVDGLGQSDSREENYKFLHISALPEDMDTGSSSVSPFNNAINKYINIGSMWGTQTNFNPKKRLTLYNQTDKRWGKIRSRHSKRHLSENCEDRRNTRQGNKGLNNYPYYGTSTKFMQINNKPRHLPWLGQKKNKKPKRAWSNTKENLAQNHILIKHEKAKKAISNAFGGSKKESNDYEDKLTANLPGIYIIELA